MVRLKVLYLCIVNDREDSFNSKNGAIKSQIIQYHQVADHVSIPKMVRLKVVIDPNGQWFVDVFQFQKWCD